MSLRDTIDGARREAEGNAVGRPKKEAENIGSGDEEKKGFSRSSAAKARPVREAASSVRLESKPKQQTSVFGGSTETKEEKRERKRREREEQDFRNRAYDLLLRSNPAYKRTERVFWIILGAGLVLAVIALACVYLFGQDVNNMAGWQGILSVGSLVAAYACMIASFIYDWSKRRPYRKQTEARIRGLSDKKLLDLLEQARAEDVAKKGVKKK